MVELVSLFPTLAELAGLRVPPSCPKTSFHVSLCTEGQSMVRYFPSAKGRHESNDDKGKPRRPPIAFSQYPRPSDTPQRNSDLPRLKDIRVMGYSMRTAYYRCTLWLGFNPSNFSVDRNDIHGGELYFEETDPNQDHNMYRSVAHGHLIKKLCRILEH